MYSVKDLYKKNIQLLSYTNKLIYYFRNQNHDYALRLTSDVITLFTSYLEVLNEYQSYFNEDYVTYNMDAVMGIFNGILKAQENKDYILLADLYELQIIPLLTKLQEILIGKEGVTLIEDTYTESIKIMEENYKGIAIELNRMPKHSEYTDNRYEIEFTSAGLMTLAVNDNGKYYLHIREAR